MEQALLPIAVSIRRFHAPFLLALSNRSFHSLFPLAFSIRYFSEVVVTADLFIEPYLSNQLRR